MLRSSLPVPGRPAILTRVTTIAREPVRAYLYGVLGPALSLLAGYGYATDSQVLLWSALGGAVLGVPATEAARARVAPVRKIPAPTSAGHGRHAAHPPDPPPPVVMQILEWERL